MPKAYSYLRFSTPDQARGDSFRRQTAMALDYAARHGLELDEALTFRDLGVSAFRGTNVAAGKLGEFQEAVRTGLVPQGSYLLVESLDRISRNQIIEAQTLFLSIVVSGVTLVTLQDGKVYSRETINNNPTDLIMSIVILMRAHEESETKSRRGKAAWANKRANATSKPLTAKCPAWLKLEGGKFTVIEPRAKIVRRIYSDALAGFGQHAITERLNKASVSTFGSAPHWRRSSVIKILDSAAVIGTLVPAVMTYDGAKKARKMLDPIEGYYPAIVDADTFHRVRLLRDQTAEPARGKHAAAPVANIIGGLALCPECEPQVSMTRINKGKGGGVAKLVCSAARAGAAKAHGFVAVRYDFIENTLVRLRKQVIRTCPPANDGARELDVIIRQTEADILETEDQLEALLDAVSRRKSKATGERIAETEAHLGELQSTLSQLRTRRRAADGAMLRARLGELEVSLGEEPIDRQKVNARLRQVLRGVIVDYRDGTLELLWHHSPETSSVVFDAFAGDQ